MKVTKLTISSYTGNNSKPHSGWVCFDDERGYHWSYAIEEKPEGGYGESDKITLMGSRKLSLGSTHFVFYSAKREAAIKEFLANSY